MEARYLPDAYYAQDGRHVRRADGRQALDQVRVRRPGEARRRLGAYLKDQMQNTTPNQSVKLLLASGDVAKVGEETVRGEHDHALLRHGGRGGPRGEAPTSARSQLADLKKQLAQAGVTTETVDIWVDDRGPAGQEGREGRADERHDDLDGVLQRLRRRRSPAEAPPAGDTDGLQGPAEAVEAGRRILIRTGPPTGLPAPPLGSARCALDCESHMCSLGGIMDDFCPYVVRSDRRRRLAAAGPRRGRGGLFQGRAEESPKMTPAAAVAKAAKNTEDITSLRYRMTGEMPGGGPGRGRGRDAA